MRRQTLLFALVAAPLAAQSPLSLRDAVRTALEHNKALEASAANVKAARTRITQAGSNWLPKLNYSENALRSDNPVMVFSTLLTQRRFGAENFAIGPLNHPDAVNNFQSQLTVDQVIYDAGQIRNGVKSAELMHDLSGEENRRAEMDVLSGVVRAYLGAVLASESLAAAREAVRSAEADLRRAETVRAAGMSTDVDVLSIRVHLAAVREQEIKRQADLAVVRAALNDVLGLPLETEHRLTTPLSAADVPERELAEYEKLASENRPETRESRIAMNLARVQSDLARSSLLPQVGVRAGAEIDRRRFFTGAAANWTAAVSLKWNLFNGFGDKARIEEAKFGLERAKAEQGRADSAVRLGVRRAWADLRAATERIEVAKASMAESQESLRITQNRYAAGLATVTDLLRNETAALDSRTRYLVALHDQRVAATMLQLSAGVLTPDSEILNR
ncbi:MAG: TolC family protein [Bryobacteraceae bacterium]